MNVAPPEGSGARSGWRRRLGGLLSIAWLGVLGWLALSSANPVTVNRLQIATAAVDGTIATLTVLDASTGRCRTEEVIAGASGELELLAKGGEITVRNLSETGAHTGRRYIVPLIRRSTEYVVGPTQLPGNPSLIYPDSADSRKQIETVLQGPLP